MISENHQRARIVHRGNNGMCCRGRCFLCAEPDRFFLTLALVNVPLLILFGLTVSFLFLDDEKNFDFLSWSIFCTVIAYLVLGTNY